MSTPQAPKGTYDLLPDEAAERDEIVAAAARVFAVYGYRHLVTPEFEETGLFERGVGEASDIVRKEMYTFPDKAKRLMTLRPEGTAPVARAYVEHGMHKLPQPVKVWYHAPMFRYEKPQTGRYREHWQIGAEAMGSAEPTVDAEVVLLLGQILVEAGVGRLRLLVNSMGDAACRPVYVAFLRDYLLGHQDELCADCRERVGLNPLRTFDCKEEACRAVLSAAPRLIDHLCDACRAHFGEVLRLLRMVGYEPQLDYRLVRGLDYYTRTTFEFQSDSPNLGPAQNAVGGGGRYDYLVEQIGGPATPGVGFGSGLERISLAREVADSPRFSVPVYVVSFVAEARGEAFAVAQLLRGEGLPGADLDLVARSVKGQFKQASRLGARLAVLVGLEESGAGEVRVRDLAGGAERDCQVAHLPALVRELLASAPQASPDPSDSGGEAG
ncbi:MAG TPA: histidine--tRNA ligase [Thermoleophilia bacterium]|nr:histidine--tRNA ligase [Thermoleophilia bacterium]